MFPHRENHPETRPASPAESDDARDLLARLYREIGISAVAAALEVTAMDRRRGESTPRPVPVQPTGKAA
jgi:hypothetical protein